MITYCKLKTTFILAMVTLVTSAEPTVTDVVAKQRYPWNGLVDITCKVSGIDGATEWKFSVAAVMPDTGNARKVSQFWVVKNGVNSTDRKVQANGTYKLLWDAQADLGAVIYSNMVMRATMVELHGKVQLWEGGPYWATTNIGAEEPEEYGYYFWWGSAGSVASNGSSLPVVFAPSNTPTYDKSIDTLKSEGWITADNIIVLARDAAHVHWGGAWRMPTKQELSDLSDKCTWYWTTLNGVRGYRVSGKGDYTSSSIFLPCAGLAYGSSLDDAGSYGYYWSSVPYSGNSYNGTWYLYFKSGGHGTNYINRRYYGMSIRPVQGFTE